MCEDTTRPQVNHCSPRPERTEVPDLSSEPPRSSLIMVGNKENG
jgi:hypothetical protein